MLTQHFFGAEEMLRYHLERWQPDAMKEIEFVLCDRQNPILKTSIFFRIYNSPIANRFFETLKETLKKQCQLTDAELFANFPGDHRDEAWIVQNLNDSINAINDFRSGAISHFARVGMSDEDTNQLHHYFEIYRGPILKPANFFSEAPPNIQKAIEDFNILIHRLEDYRFNQRKIAGGRGPAAKFWLTFKGEHPRYELHEDDYQHFTTRTEFGTLYLNYPEVGKQIFDVYRDNDNDWVGDANIRPMRHYSADCMAEFSQTTTKEDHQLQMEKFWQWWDGQGERMQRLSFQKFDPRNAVGQLPVASIVRDKGGIKSLSNEKLIEHVGEHQLVREIVLHELGAN